MQKFIASLTAILFIAWILPLGFFITPSKEKIACNGQRAICMCSHAMAKQSAKNVGVGKAAYKGSGAAQKEQNGPGGSSHHFLAVQKKNQINRQISFYHREQSTFYSLLVVRPIEHVPKA